MNLIKIFFLLFFINIFSQELEFRAVWVASVANINWPSEPGLSTDKQKEEAISIIESVKNTNMNTIILQVRPQCDALYYSEIEPWSYFLTGETGLPPEPFYDPLKFWIDESHKRGIKIHAWLNPYRANHPQNKSINQKSIINTKNELVFELKNGYWWLNPTDKNAMQHSLNVVYDIVKRYDIDGIHFDDYFYPYPSYNNGEDFPDHELWKKSKKNIFVNNKNNWRRKSVNSFIKKVNKGIKKIKPHVVFGISPFGIWRPKHPNIADTSFDQYDMIFADPKKWLKRGWADYFSPQLYWTIDNPKYSYPILLDWWNSQNKKNKKIWPGIRLSNYSGKDQIKEVINQIKINKSKNNLGIVFWSFNELKNNPELSKALVDEHFKN